MINLTYDRKNKTKAVAKQASLASEDQTEALVETIFRAGEVASASRALPPKPRSGPRPHHVIKLGIDVHLNRYVVVCQIDGGAPQPPQRFSPSQFLDWAEKQTTLADASRAGLQLLRSGPFWLQSASEAGGV